MMDAKFTPGPWVVDPNALHDVRAADGKDVAIAICKQMSVLHINPETVSPETRDTAIANARLIAAAPELLKALQVLAEEADNFNVSGVYFNEKCMGHRGLALAAAAIAAATGAP